MKDWSMSSRQIEETTNKKWMEGCRCHMLYAILFQERLELLACEARSVIRYNCLGQPVCAKALSELFNRHLACCCVRWIRVNLFGVRVDNDKEHLT